MTLIYYKNYWWCQWRRWWWWWCNNMQLVTLSVSFSCGYFKGEYFSNFEYNNAILYFYFKITTHTFRSLNIAHDVVCWCIKMLLFFFFNSMKACLSMKRWRPVEGLNRPGAPLKTSNIYLRMWSNMWSLTPMYVVTSIRDKCVPSFIWLTCAG